MTDRPNGLVLRAMERIQTQRPDHADKPPVKIQIPDPPLSSILGGAARGAVLGIGAASRPAEPSIDVGTDASFPPKPSSVILWACIAIGCIGLVLAAGVFVFLPSRDRTVVASAPPAQAPAPAPAPTPAAAAPAAAGQPVAQNDDLVVLGNGLLSMGDVATARLYFERAAETGNGRAARLVGKTYDPGFLSLLGVHGMRGDPEAAARWYQRARDLGDADAEAVPSPN
jgi:hypothetical protein